MIAEELPGVHKLLYGLIIPLKGEKRAGNLVFRRTTRRNSVQLDATRHGRRTGNIWMSITPPSDAGVELQRVQYEGANLDRVGSVHMNIMVALYTTRYHRTFALYSKAYAVGPLQREVGSMRAPLAGRA